MTDLENPYAAPATRPAPIDALASRPMPDGFRRYPLDPALYRVAFAKARRRQLLVVLPVLAIYFAATYASGAIDATTMAVAFVVFFVLLGIGRLRRGSLEKRIVSTFEIVASPRALRRVTIVPAAEILLPEVTSIVEMSDGLSIASTTPERRLFVPTAIAGYAELRARLAAVRPFESAKGFAALKRRFGHFRREALRDEEHGTILATDLELREELALLRATSLVIPENQIVRPRRRLGWALALWLVLVVLFMGIWMLLSPADPTVPRPHRGAPAVKTH